MISRSDLRGLRARLLLLAVLTAVPLFALVLYNAVEQRRQAVRDAIAEAVHMADHASQTEERLATETRDFLAALAEVPAVRRADRLAADRIFADVIAREKRYGNLGLADRNGRVFASGVPMRGAVDIRDRSYFRRVLETRGFSLGEYQIGRITGRPGLNFGYPVVGESGEVEGVLFAALDLAWLNRFPPDKGAVPPPGSTVTRIDRNGTVFAHFPGGEEWLGKTLPSPGLATIVLSRGQGFEEAMGPDGTSRIYVFTKIRRSGGFGEMYVVLGIPRQMLFADADKRMGINLAGLFLVMTLAFGAAYVGARGLVLRPVNAILAAVNRISSGDYSTRTGVPASSGELGDLAGGVDRMAESLAQRDDARRQAEDALRESERQFRALIENATDIITVVDEAGVVGYHSPSLERILGYRPEEMIGRNAFEFIHPQDLPAVGDALRRVIEKPGSTATAIFRFRHRDGSWRHLESTGKAVAGAGGRVTVVVNSRDVSERILAEEALHRSEEQLLQAQKMEAVGRLAGGVAHDFNNLLTAIMGYTEILLRRMGAGEAGRAEIEEIRKAGERAAALTRQLLTFSRRQIVQPTVLDLNATVAGMDAMLKRLIGEDVAVKTDLAPGLWPVTADPGQIGQLVVNLAVNARDAMPRGGALTLRTGNVMLATPRIVRDVALPAGPYVTLAIADTGCGMDEETMSHLFEPFFTTKEKGKGTGLGLSTVYGIVRQGCGAIEVDSAPGSGTTVTVYLPMATGSAEATVAAEHEPVKGGRETILVVEDEETVRELVCEILRSRGYSVLRAPGGPEALDLIERHEGPIDLLVSDVVMPGMSGRELADRVVARRPGIPVLYMSGYTQDIVGNHGVPQGGMAFIPKPFKPAAFARRVREILDRRSAA